MPHNSAEHTSSPETLIRGLQRAEKFVLAEGFRGYDPYDALTSPLFRLPGLRSNRLVRRGAQQVLRRAPFNVRPLLGIHKGLSPVTPALVLQAWAALADAYPPRREGYAVAGEGLVRKLEELSSPGWSGTCWGYDFDWETRDGPVPAGTPTVVATGFVANGLFLASEALGLEAARALCDSACAFILEDLQRTAGADASFCWSYSPSDRSRVLNATAKGSRLLAQIYAVTGREELREAAERSLRYVAQHQRDDGSWPYAVDDPRTWSDNFHTGYVLDALAEYGARTGDSQFAEVAERGWRYYRAHFFDDDTIPRYYDNALYPIDATACAQALLTLLRYGDLETALRVAAWTIEHMQKPDGSFAYRIHRRFTNRVQYMRWSTAWMFCGLAAVQRAVVVGSQAA
jgi:hypothetical protein